MPIPDITFADLRDYLSAIMMNIGDEGDGFLERCIENIRNERLDDTVDDGYYAGFSESTVAAVRCFSGEMLFWTMVLWTNFCASWHMLSWAAIVGKE